ncbi:hypothetical protein GcM1_c14161o29 [Golovinomyces cichoracearum]|uniref:Uncharacterized protein n=1 Tax=Golovinomyces cichoracearum TaxID=62708 RepID=A0A420IPW6_9PEZI|nr:hypothetical protein GcM1_c14161o29 [Golovinomyces cichoracearum]
MQQASRDWSRLSSILMFSALFRISCHMEVPCDEEVFGSFSSNIKMTSL